MVLKRGRARVLLMGVLLSRVGGADVPPQSESDRGFVPPELDPDVVGPSLRFDTRNQGLHGTGKRIETANADDDSGQSVAREVGLHHLDQPLRLAEGELLATEIEVGDTAQGRDVPLAHRAETYPAGGLLKPGVALMPSPSVRWQLDAPGSQRRSSGGGSRRRC